MSNLLLILIGYALAIAGLVWAGVTLGLPTTWIVIGALVVAGLGLVNAVGRARRREESPSD